MLKKSLFLSLFLFLFLFTAKAYAVSPQATYALNQGAYMLGRTLYKNDGDLSARQSFLECKSRVKVYNKNIAESNGNELGFLRLMSPGELSYCWSGYLDAAGENK